MKIHFLIAVGIFFLFCLVCIALNQPNSEFNLARTDAENVYGTWTGIAFDDAPPVHQGYSDWGIVDCEKKTPADCYFCVGANYEPACQGTVTCGTEAKRIIQGDPSGGHLQRDPEPTNSACSQKLCNGVNTYCGQGAVTRYKCG
jgi:hypothetical protein